MDYTQDNSIALPEHNILIFNYLNSNFWDCLPSSGRVSQSETQNRPSGQGAPDPASSLRTGRTRCDICLFPQDRANKEFFSAAVECPRDECLIYKLIYYGNRKNTHGRPAGHPVRGSQQNVWRL